MGKKPNQDTSDPVCIDCYLPLVSNVGGVAICDECLAVRGSCCPEFGSFDLASDAVDDRSRKVGANSGPACPAPPVNNAQTGEDAIRHDQTVRRFETEGGAHLDYVLSPSDELEITHTFVPEMERGKGLAARLMKAALAYAQAEGLNVRASCSYAEAYLRKYG
jgi:predicted GNAT family acetyltransferase